MYLCKVYLLKGHRFAWFCAHACARYITTGITTRYYALVNTECLCVHNSIESVMCLLHVQNMNFCISSEWDSMNKCVYVCSGQHECM